MLLSSLFASFIAFEAVFYQSIYPTAVGFTKQLGDNAKSFLALTGFAGAGVGGTLAGALSGPLVNRAGRRRTVLIGFALSVCGNAIALVSLPREAAQRPADSATLLEPSGPLLVAGKERIETSFSVKKRGFP